MFSARHIFGWYAQRKNHLLSLDGGRKHAMLLHSKGDSSPTDNQTNGGTTKSQLRKPQVSGQEDFTRDLEKTRQRRSRRDTQTTAGPLKRSHLEMQKGL